MRTLPTTCVHSCSVSRVALHSATGSAGHVSEPAHSRTRPSPAPVHGAMLPQNGVCWFDTSGRPGRSAHLVTRMRDGCQGGSGVDSVGDVAVSCSGLSKSFDDERVVGDLDLDIAEGSIVGLIGPSGCGKTTTVRLLVGLLEPTTGTATVWGTPATALSARAAPADRLPAADPGAVPRPVAVGEPQLPRLDVRAAAAPAPSPAPRAGVGGARRAPRTRRCARCRAACSGASRWPRRSSTTRPSCSSTSRRRASTRSCAARSGSSSGRCATRAARCA